MRLTPRQIDLIKVAAHRALGVRKVDVLLKDGVTPDAPIFEIAKRTGVLL